MCNFFEEASSTITALLISGVASLLSSVKHIVLGSEDFMLPFFQLHLLINENNSLLKASIPRFSFSQRSKVSSLMALPSTKE